jgi:hypothetical protein
MKGTATPIAAGALSPPRLLIPPNLLLLLVPKGARWHAEEASPCEKDPCKGPHCWVGQEGGLHAVIGVAELGPIDAQELLLHKYAPRARMSSELLGKEGVMNSIESHRRPSEKKERAGSEDKASSLVHHFRSGSRSRGRY